jgi:MFS-type transporter involved in bile tolerance (Atg22 family)
MASWASYQIAFLAEVVPTPKAYLFFALFNTVGRTSGFVGPFVSSAIIDASDGNTNMAFIFLVSMGLIGLVILWFVDPSKAKLDNAKCESFSFSLLRRSVTIDGEDRGWADG